MPLDKEEYVEYFNAFSHDYDKVCMNDIQWSPPAFSVKKIIPFLPKAQTIRVHETGIGTGLVFEEFNTQTSNINFDYYGCDLSRKMIHKARSRIPNSHLKTLDANEDRLPWPKNTADISCSIGVFQFLSNRVFALKEMIKTTKKGGLVMISALNFRKTNDGTNLEPAYEDAYESVKRRELADYMKKEGLKVIIDENYISYKHGNIEHYDNIVIAKMP